MKEPMPGPASYRRRRSIHMWLSLAMKAIVAAGFVLSWFEGGWLNSFLIGAILLLTVLPALLGRGFRIFIPPEFELLAVLFIFASLWLGEVRGFYERYWWWDIALHTTSGFLLGIVGFLLVYVLNSEPRIDIHMKPGFVALFSFVFAVALGALWEIFEFTVDGLTGYGMQKGNTDTMRDLIVDSLGALVISLLGYFWLRTGFTSFLERWIDAFIVANPRLFRKRRERE